MLQISLNGVDISFLTSFGNFVGILQVPGDLVSSKV